MNILTKSHINNAIADMDNGKELLKLYVEENDVGDDRIVNCKNIESQQLNDRVQEKSLAPSASTADVNIVSQLFDFVKSFNKKSLSAANINKVLLES